MGVQSRFWPMATTPSECVVPSSPANLSKAKEQLKSIKETSEVGTELGCSLLRMIELNEASLALRFPIPYPGIQQPAPPASGESFGFHEEWKRSALNMQGELVYILI